MTITPAPIDTCQHCGEPQYKHAGKKRLGLCPNQVGQDGHRWSSTLRLPDDKIRLGIPGGGPWRINELCPAPGHNTNYAESGRGGALRCICPRAQALKREKNRLSHIARAERRKMTRAQKARERRAVEARQPSKMILAPKPLKDAEAPSFRGAACANPMARESVDAGFNTFASAAGIRERQRAKSICDSCPLRDSVCEPYIRKHELPAGSWGGVWAGMDPWERMGQTMVIDLNGSPKLVPYVPA